MIPRKLRSRRGMTLAETLAALAVFVILSAALVVGTVAAWKVYQKAVVASEARTLQSTLTQSLTDELRYAGNIRTDGDVVSFDSRTFGLGVSVSSADGKILVGTYELLPAKAYTKGLVADAAVSYSDGFFTVELVVRHDLLPDGERKTTLTVRALNAVSGQPPAGGIQIGPEESRQTPEALKWRVHGASGRPFVRTA